MQNKNFKKSYLLNLLQQIDNDEYNLKANQNKKIYNPSSTVDKKGFKYKPKENLKSNKRFTPQNLPDYSTAQQKNQKIDKSLYVKNVLRGHLEPDVINDIVSLLDQPRLNYLYNSAPYVIRELGKNYNKSAVTPDIFLEFLHKLYSKQNKEEPEQDDEKDYFKDEEDEEYGDDDINPDLLHSEYLTDETLKDAFEEATKENADLMEQIEEKEAEAEGHVEALHELNEAPAPSIISPKASPKRRGRKSKPKIEHKILEDTSFYGAPIESYREFNSLHFDADMKKAILGERFDELSPYFSYFGQQLEYNNIKDLKMRELNKGYKAFFESVK